MVCFVDHLVEQMDSLNKVDVNVYSYVFTFLQLFIAKLQTLKCGYLWSVQRIMKYNISWSYVVFSSTLEAMYSYVCTLVFLTTKDGADVKLA